ncbi:hypothetical protein Z043_103040 [Scleropages formosus]|uniref:G-protein coupled receptors family 1 profile domain-containing protein n=1 Tax=Scleropages formosus TaxID=113540 RepID=A0A0N8K2E7_SCLFO|nr:hypothetical protein Z043_103040 [Scleropages formosus]
MSLCNLTAESSCNASLAEEPHRIALLTVYSVVLLGGSTGIVLMISILKSSLRSLTTIAMLNIIVVHLLFLCTVPFRMYYYVENRWRLSQGFCKVVSGTIHGHMHIAFLFYTIILSIRYHTFYWAVDQLEFYRKLHAVGASLVVWAMGLAIGFPVLFFTYSSNSTAEEKCFKFGRQLELDVGVRILNYIVSFLLVVVAVALACCQAHILWRIFRRYGATMYTQQEFGAQKKSLCFMLVIMVCFVPYHVFRIYYVSHSAHLEDANEVFLSLTALSCLDTLTFLDRGMFCI